jgi:molybdopterin-guanine dinucleotide biosynthesis protein A
MPREYQNTGEPQPLIRGITGVILAGGKSLRFGRNKAFAEVNGRQLIERVTGLLGSVFEELIIITNNPDEYSFLGLPMYEDLVKGLGPIGGIYTGLEKIRYDAGFFVACDMPFMNGVLIRHMAEAKGGFDAVVPKIGWKMEPLHALYSISCLPQIKGLIASGECMINKFFQNINVRFLNEEEIRVHDPLLRSFFNINKPDELLDALNWEAASQEKK